MYSEHFCGDFVKNNYCLSKGQPKKQIAIKINVFVKYKHNFRFFTRSCPKLKFFGQVSAGGLSGKKHSDSSHLSGRPAGNNQYALYEARGIPATLGHEL
ncbi:MAG: hypothetical protein PHY43_16010 [Verrucomicrobiales bacterium]|nr:hypothetical protein [Verrucomicrobiales bacterium]